MAKEENTQKPKKKKDLVEIEKNEEDEIEGKIVEAIIGEKIEDVEKVLEGVPAKIIEIVDEKRDFSSWVPKTKLGKQVKEGKIKDINYILDNNLKILEPEIVDKLVDLKTDLLLIGQSKGKFGGGKRRAWRQTQKKTQARNVPTFSAMAIIGDEKGHIGIGEGKGQETLPARDKAIRKAKLNIIKIKRACADFDCACNEPHSVPFKVEGKAGSVKIIFYPAPQGTGLVVAGELKKILKLAGIKDIYSKSFGNQRTTFNLAKACIDALRKTNKKVGERAI